MANLRGPIGRETPFEPALDCRLPRRVGGYDVGGDGGSDW